MKVVKGEELYISTPNKVGALAELSEKIASANVNIRAISAWAVGDTAFFRIITSDNTKVKDILKENNYNFETKEVVIAELPDRIGELGRITKLLKDKNIDLEYIYGTTSSPEQEAIVIFSSNNNEEALKSLEA